MKDFWKKFNKLLKNLSKTLKYIHNKTSYLYTYLFFDIIWCYIRYGITYNEYRIFEFYDVSSYKRGTFMSKRKYNSVNKRLVDHKITNVIKDKKLFLKRFKDYIKIEFNNVKDMSFKEFEETALSCKNIIARSLSNSFVSSFVKYDISKYRSPAFALQDITDKKIYLVSKNITQHKSLNEINDLVLINVVSVISKNGIDAVTSSLKYKVDGKIISGNINAKTGKIVGRFKDENGHTFGENFEGFEIPSYDEIMSLTLNLAKELEEIRQVEWTFAVGSRGTVYLIDANIWNDYVFAQTPEFLENNIGLMSYYDKIK